MAAELLPQGNVVERILFVRAAVAYLSKHTGNYRLSVHECVLPVIPNYLHEV